MSDGMKGTIPCQLFGGPLDGAKYGDLPDTGGPYTGAALSIPLVEPAETSPRAVYTCHGDAPVAGLWQFFYERTDFPELEAMGLSISLPETPSGTSVATRPFDPATQVALARGLASLAHNGQTDRDGSPILGHIARVAARFDPVAYPVAHAAAWLHDIGRHSSMTIADLHAAGIHAAILRAVDLLTRPRGWDDAQYYDRMSDDPLVRAVKLIDLADRGRDERLGALDPVTGERLGRRYNRARRRLETQAGGR